MRLAGAHSFGGRKGELGETRLLCVIGRRRDRAQSLRQLWEGRIFFAVCNLIMKDKTVEHGSTSTRFRIES